MRLTLRLFKHKNRKVSIQSLGTLFISSDEVRAVQARGCHLFSPDEDPGNGKMSRSNIEMFFAEEGVKVSGEVYLCSTDNCNNAIYLRFSSVLCAFLIFAALVLKEL